MSGNLYIGVDLGTTTIKVGVFDTSGSQVALRSTEFHLNQHSNFVEFNIDEYVEIIFANIREAMASLGVSAAKVRGLSVASQAQTFVLLGEDGRPLRPAISWLDVRAKEEAKLLTELSQKELKCATDAIASAPKILWIAQNEPDTLKKLKYVLLLPDYLIFKLTGKRISDVRVAESTGFYDRFNGRWVNSLLNACNLHNEMMSEVGWPGQFAGLVKPDIAEKLNLPQSVVVAVGAMDQLAGAIGAGNVQAGCASINLGTALPIIVSAHTGKNIAAGISIRPHPVRGLDAFLTYTKTAGIVLRWFKENFADPISYQELFEHIARIPIGSEGLKCVPHFNGTATPKFDPSVKGMFSGITLNHNKFHFARSIIEALCFCITENIRIIADSTETIKCIRAIGGGAKSDIWLQMIADCTHITVQRPCIMESCCFGAAQFAMVADKAFEDIVTASTKMYKNDCTFYPSPENKPLYDKLFSEYSDFYKSLNLT